MTTTKIADRLAVEVRLFVIHVIHVIIPAAACMALTVALDRLGVPWAAGLFIAWRIEIRLVGELGRKLKP